MNYAEALARLVAAENRQARSVTLEINEGTFTVTPEEARESWEILAPGEPFIIHEINI